MTGFHNLAVLLFFCLFACFSCADQEGVVPPGVKVAKTAVCGEEVRTDNGVLLPILKGSIGYPDFLVEMDEEVFWVLIKYDVGVDSVPKNISVTGDFDRKIKKYFREQFLSWRFPPCLLGGKVSEIVGEQILLRVSK